MKPLDCKAGYCLGVISGFLIMLLVYMLDEPHIRAFLVEQILR